MNIYKNYYKILKINKSATDKEIRDAYFKLAKIYHPDKNHITESVQMFQEIKEAYDVLMKQRKEYDATCLHFIKTLDIELDVVFEKLTNVVSYQVIRNCKKCDKTGYDVRTEGLVCCVCRGAGEDENGNECKRCNGQGKRYSKKCDTCNGRKQHVINVSLNISLTSKVSRHAVPLAGNQSLKNNHIGQLILNIVWL